MKPPKLGYIPLILLLAGSLILSACNESQISEISVNPPEDLSADTDLTTLLPNEELDSSPVIPNIDELPGVARKVSGGNVLLFGDRAGDKAQLAADLTGLGYTVTNVTVLPLDLSPYLSVWHVGAFSPLTAAEQTRLATFLAGGGGVHLTGERPCCEAMNASIASLVNSVVAGGGITVGGLGDFLPQGPFFTFNGGAVGGITTTPNALTKWSPAAPGGMAGVAAANVLVTHDATGTTNGGAWECSNLTGGNGQLSLLMDVNWFNNSFNPAASRIPEVQNIQTFLERNCILEVDIDIKPGSDPNSINCSNEKVAIAVAILTTDDFDATTVDHTTVTFEGASETHVDKKTNAPRRHEEDVDGDGDIDLVLHFRAGDTGLDCGSTAGTLSGATFDGQAIEGTDAVRMVDVP